MEKSKYSQEHIQNNALATKEELLWLKEQDPVATILHPNCPAELWWELATKHPLKAKESLLYSVLTLESPEHWAKLEKANIRQWIRDTCQELSFEEQHLFVADCAERVLPVFEEKYPDDNRPREAIRVRRRFGRGEATEEEWNTARAAARAVFHRGGFINISAPRLWFAIRGAADTTAEADTKEAAESAVFTAATYAASEMRNSDAFERAAFIERQWQWERLQLYLKGSFE